MPDHSTKAIGKHRKYCKHSISFWEPRMLLRRQGIHAQCKGLVAEYKCPAKQSSPILPCPVITDTKSAPFPSSPRLALTFYVQQTWKKPFNLLLWVNSILLSQGVIVNVTIINITTAIIFTMSWSVVVSSWPISPPPWPIPSWSLSPSFHEHRFCGIHCAASFSRKISPDMILIVFILLKQTNKKPKAQKRKWFSWEYTLSQSLGKNSNPSSLSIATRFPHC